MRDRRLPRNAGIVLGPILFVIAILFVIGGALAMGGSTFGGAITADTVSQELGSQANLIRSKINECEQVSQARGALANITGTDQSGYPDPDLNSPNTPILVSALNCPGDPADEQNIWAGSRPASLPAPPPGFGPWYYVNYGIPSSGGATCIYIQPLSGGNADSKIVEGINNTLKKFGTSEYVYNTTTQTIYFWIRTPASGSHPACGA